ncbi:MAG: Gfo/Idh/MocA family oxidoreductase [Subdoligranulum sp.]|nr:Gfo/Idh/MocA family oxidoreductase [Subdoligranulum sp.]
MFSVGMIGAGSIGASHLAAVEHHPDTRLVAVADIVWERAQKAAAPYGASAYSRYEEMLEKEHPQLVIINLPHGLHETCVLTCAQFGAHMLLEKPMSVSHKSCVRMETACKAADVLLQVGHVQRYIPQNRAVRAMIETGRLGELAMICDLRTNNYFTPKRPRWFLNRAMAGGGISMNYAAHSLDKIQYLTQSSIERMTGSCTYLQPETDVDGSAQMLLQTQSGVSASVSLCGYSVVPKDETMLFFSRGALRLHTGSDVAFTVGGTYEEIDCTCYPNAFDAQWADFISGVRQGRILHCDSAYGAAIIKWIEQLYEKE